MPLDVLGRTRATLTKSASMSYADRCGESSETLSCWGLIFEILDHERGIPSKRKSAACVDYVPALCTHRPSLLPIGWFSEHSGLAPPAQRWVGGGREVVLTVSSRGSKSRNKVSVGEPAEGSLTSLSCRSSRRRIAPTCTVFPSGEARASSGGALLREEGAARSEEARSGTAPPPTPPLVCVPPPVGVFSLKTARLFFFVCLKKKKV